MGRHRSTLRDLGWGASNSPNPWKQGSAKRVVRALDYSNIELDEPGQSAPPAAHPPPAAQPAAADRMQRLQQDGKKLDRIREQFEAEDAENKRKLERLNGRIAELGEGKRHVWSILGQGSNQQQAKPSTAAEAPRQAPVEPAETRRPATAADPLHGGGARAEKAADAAAA